MKQAIQPQRINLRQPPPSRPSATKFCPTESAKADLAVRGLRLQPLAKQLFVFFCWLMVVGCGGQVGEEETAVSPLAPNPIITVVATPTSSPVPSSSETAATEAASTSPATPEPATSLAASYEYEGVTLQYDAALVSEMSGETIAAMAGTYGFGIEGPPLFYYGVPDFLRLHLAYDGSSVRPPLIVIQPVRDETGAIYESYQEWDIKRFEQLSLDLQTQSDPTLLAGNGQPVAQASFLNFQNGTGLRQVSHIPGGLGMVDINNGNVFYTFEGLTNNGRYLVWFQFPVQAPVLSNEAMALEDLENLYRSDDAYNAYFRNKMGQLAELAPADFNPPLEQLDAMVQTFFVPDNASTETSLPANDPDCINDGTFIADVTIPDGSSVAARETFVKTWRLRNSGTCFWSAAYELIADGSSPIEYIYENRPFGAVAPGEEVEVSVKLMAPALAGSYRADWQLFEPYDVTALAGSFPEPFGPRIYVEIVVPESGEPDPPPLGSWQIYSYAFGVETDVGATAVGATAVGETAVAEASANAAVGNILTLDANTITYNGESCTSPSYSSRYVDPAPYLAQTYQIGIETLYISNENVEVITTGCELAGLDELLRLSTIHNETLIFQRDGIFYFLYQQ